LALVQVAIAVRVSAAATSSGVAAAHHDLGMSLGYLRGEPTIQAPPSSAVGEPSADAPQKKKKGKKSE